MNTILVTVISSVLTSFIIVRPVAAVSPTQTVSPTPTTTVEQKVEYLLPYPGILPDHPLYFLKALRDKILEALIVDPLRKSEFYLLQADKRLNMAIFFGNRGAAAQVAQSVTIAEQFMERTVQGLVAFKKAGSQVPASLVDRLEKSMAKHVEVLENMAVNATEGQRQVYANALEKVRGLLGEVGKLK